jgi:hypothetical protein
LNLVQFNVDALDNWDGVGCSLSCTILGLGEDILAEQGLWDRFFLNWGRELKTHFVDALNASNKVSKRVS